VAGIISVHFGSPLAISFGFPNPKPSMYL